MRASRFEELLRDLPKDASRRGVLRSLALLALTAIGLPGAVVARKKHKRKKKKVKRNDFGCVNVGNFCKNSGQCCSGICQVKNGKLRCQAHDQTTCGGQNQCAGEEIVCTSTTDFLGVCQVTTGNASYCAAAFACFDCTKDADCVPSCGAGAACIVCEEGCSPLGTACVGTGTTICTV